MNSCKTCETVRKAIAGAVGLWVGFVVIRSVPEVIRYMRIIRP
jgi:hypothetical protein